MKEIKAVIRPNKLGVLRDALVALPGFPGRLKAGHINGIWG